MKIILLGYGRMGRQIEQVAQAQGILVADRLDRFDTEDLRQYADGLTVAIEFTQPEAAFDNVAACLHAGLPVVSGTTGWNARIPEAQRLCRELGGTFLHASNFSLGVNFLLVLARMAGRFFQGNTAFEAAMLEVHHIHKKDAPSGTAISIAEAFLSQQSRLSGYGLAGDDLPEDKLPIEAIREGEAVGDHALILHTEREDITLSHSARDRGIFAEGAVQAARFVLGKQGVFTMGDVLGLE